MYIGIPYTIKKPIIAPSSDKIRLTSMDKNEMIAENIKVNQVNCIKFYYFFFGLATKVIY
jgi:hypothetical protein